MPLTISELKARVESLPPLIASNIWQERCLQLREKILTDNPEIFLQWPTVNSTMFVANAPYLINELTPLKIQDPGFGGPVMYSANLSGNYIHQGYHLKQWQDKTGKQVGNLGHIVEFGGGYGAMAVICRQLGFEGDYAIIDLPEFSLLQEYYLSNTGYLDKVQFVSEFSGDCDLLIAIHSLSEVDLATRSLTLESIQAKHALFVYSCEYEGIDNLAWFKQLPGQKWVTPHYTNQVYQVR